MDASFSVRHSGTAGLLPVRVSMDTIATLSSDILDHLLKVHGSSGHSYYEAATTGKQSSRVL